MTVPTITPLGNPNIQGSLVDPAAIVPAINNLIAARMGQSQLLFALLGANMNVTTDQVFVPIFTIKSYLLVGIRAVYNNKNLDTAAGGIYDTASKGGNALVADSQVYSALAAAGDGVDLTLATLGKGLQVATPILSLTTAQGASGLADFYAYGIPLT